MIWVFKNLKSINKKKISMFNHIITFTECVLFMLAKMSEIYIFKI